MQKTERIQYYESVLDKILAANRALEEALEQYAATQPLVRELNAYYGSREWRNDLAEDEAGLLPSDLKRGVLSEDGAYDALSDNHTLLVRMLELVADSLRG